MGNLFDYCNGSVQCLFRSGEIDSVFSVKFIEAFNHWLSHHSIIPIARPSASSGRASSYLPEIRPARNISPNRPTIIFMILFLNV